MGEKRKEMGCRIQDKSNCNQLGPQMRRLDANHPFRQKNPNIVLSLEHVRVCPECTVYECAGARV